MKARSNYKKIFIVIIFIFLVLCGSTKNYAAINIKSNYKSGTVITIIKNIVQKLNILDEKNKKAVKEEIKPKVVEVQKEEIKEEPKQIDFLYVKEDSLLKKEASSSADNVTVLIKGTNLIDLKEKVTKSDGTVYYKVKIEDKNYAKSLTGYVLKRVISEEKINYEKQNISIEEKNKIVNEALKIDQLKTVYSQERREENFKDKNGKSGFMSGEYNKKTTYYFDCSSFCATVYKRTFGINLKYKTSEGEEKIWTTYEFLRDFKRKDAKFEKVQEVLKNGQKIKISDLQIGDLLIGEYEYKDPNSEKKSNNHIMLYIGQGYIVHSTSSYKLGDTSTEKRTEVVKEKLDTDIYYYTKLDTATDTLRFNKSIRVLRFKGI